jgi:hypothetical protein
MVIVALLAVGLGVFLEAKNHIERDRMLRSQADGYRRAAIHFQRALECEQATECRKPYKPAERAKLLAGDRLGMPISPRGFRSWEHEMLNHQYWGNRVFDAVDSLDARLQAIEARLLLPVSFGR